MCFGSHLPLESLSLFSFHIGTKAYLKELLSAKIELASETERSVVAVTLTHKTITTLSTKNNQIYFSFLLSEIIYGVTKEVISVTQGALGASPDEVHLLDTGYVKEVRALTGYDLIFLNEIMAADVACLKQLVLIFVRKLLFDSDYFSCRWLRMPETILEGGFQCFVEDCFVVIKGFISYHGASSSICLSLGHIGVPEASHLDVRAGVGLNVFGFFLGVLCLRLLVGSGAVAFAYLFFKFFTTFLIIAALTLFLGLIRDLTGAGLAADYLG